MMMIDRKKCNKRLIQRATKCQISNLNVTYLVLFLVFPNVFCGFQAASQANDCGSMSSWVPPGPPLFTSPPPSGLGPPTGLSSSATRAPPLGSKDRGQT